MKHRTHTYAVTRYSNQPVYPNAADTNYFANKALEILAAVASGMGCLIGMVFLVIIA